MVTKARFYTSGREDFTLEFDRSFNVNGSVIPAIEMVPGTEVVGAALAEGKTIKASNST